MKETLLNVATVVLTLCALVVTGLVVRREFFPQAAPGGPEPPRAVSDWRGYASAGHRIGPANAPLTVVAFSDFQCPFCGVLAKNLAELRRKHPGDVAVVFRHYPLGNHPHAVAAARASDCAAEQGRFEAFHDSVFFRQDSIGNVPWTRFAALAEVPDTAAFARCAAAPGPVATVARDTVAARGLEVSGTPTLLLNDMRYVGALPLDSLEAHVRRAKAAGAR
ncbi:MAG TPA: thioredoxin domain-containing protein [Longimicrobiaceae bacterium]